MDDPQRRGSRQCDGMNPDTAFQIVPHRRFSNVVSQTRRFLKHAFTLPSEMDEWPVFELALRCRQGRHRSVAAAETLGAVIEMRMAYGVLIDHRSLFSPENRRGPCGCPGSCSFVGEWTLDRVKALYERTFCVTLAHWDSSG